MVRSWLGLILLHSDNGLWFHQNSLWTILPVLSQIVNRLSKSTTPKDELLGKNRIPTILEVPTDLSESTQRAVEVTTQSERKTTLNINSRQNFTILGELLSIFG